MVEEGAEAGSSLDSIKSQALDNSHEKFRPTAFYARFGSRDKRIQVEDATALACQGEGELDAIDAAPETATPRDFAMLGSKARLDLQTCLLAERDCLRCPETAHDPRHEI